MTRVLITGGAGMVGSHIADQLTKKQAADVIVLDNFVRGRRENLACAMSHGSVRLVEGDIRDRKLLANVMQDVDIVFHQAAVRVTQCAEEPRLGMEILVEGSFNVLEAAAKAGVRKVVAASSASIYGMAEEFPTSESHHPYNNRTLYGAAKTFNEGLLRSFYEMYGLNYVALRYFNVYGPRMDTFGAYTEVLIRWMQRIRAGEPPLIFGNGSETMDLIFVEDIADANLLAARSSATDEVFNIGSGVEISLNDLAMAVARVMGSNLGPEYIASRKVNSVSRRLADTRAAAEKLGFRAKTTLELGLKLLVDWWRQQGNCP